jgi:hypothetical protein
MKQTSCRVKVSNGNLPQLLLNQHSGHVVRFIPDAISTSPNGCVVRLKHNHMILKSVWLASATFLLLFVYDLKFFYCMLTVYKALHA